MTAIHELVAVAARVLALHTDAPTITSVDVDPHAPSGPVLAAHLRGHLNDPAADLLEMASWAERLAAPVVLTSKTDLLKVTASVELWGPPGEATTFTVWTLTDHRTADDLLAKTGQSWQEHTVPGRPWTRCQRVGLHPDELRTAVIAWTAERAEAA